MARDSLLRDLRLSFSLATFLLAGLVALGAAAALHHSLETEDAAVLSSQGAAILASLAHGHDPEGPQALESATWRLVDPQGAVLKEGPGAEPLRSLHWPSRPAVPVEDEEGGRLWSLMVLDTPQGRLQLAMDRSHEEELLGRLHRILGISLLLAALGSAAVGHFVAKRGLRPLSRIQEDASRIEAKDLQRRLEAKDFPEELGGLVDSLNAALARLHGAFARMEHLAGDMAHELRTPLQNLRLELEGLVLRPKAPEAQREILGSALEELDRLGAMVEQMLFLARASRPGAVLDLKDLPVRPCLEEAAAFFAAAAEEAGISLSVDAPEDLIVRSDAGLLQRALQNLLANALRHTPRGGHVELSAIAGPGATVIRLKDDGEGIPADLLPRLGERFARAEDSRARDRGGAGLGLAIVREILDLHGGRFEVESGMDRGTRIRLSFPQRQS